MARTEFAVALERRIAHAYRSSRNRLGWRLLYSPEHVLDGADVAFIGMNPGGEVDDPDHAEFAMQAKRSAYRDETWPSGSQRLQQQALALFDRLEVAPENVLAGNLVPYRSPNWDSLPDPEQAIMFGTEIWGAIIERARPRCVVTYGKVANDAVAGMLDVRETKSVPVNWGTNCAMRGRFELEAGRGTWIGLPHLSRFTVVTRPESREAMDTVLDGV
jgi:hypothetical protein